MTEPETSSLAIDVIADVACPWCYIGKRRLEQVIAAFQGVSVHVRWRPYQLEPRLPRDGVDRKASSRTGGSDADRTAAIEAEIAAAGREVGLNFRFDRILRAPNTLDAHRLVRIAKIGGVQGKMVERLFRAYLVEGEDIGSRRRLIELGVETGLDRETLEDVFAGTDDVQSVEDEIATTRRLGVTTVPFFIFGEDVVVPGAQGKDMLAAALAKALKLPSRAN